MESLQNLRNALFLECKKELEDLHKIDSIEDFLTKKNVLSDLSEKCSTLLFLHKIASKISEEDSFKSEKLEEFQQEYDNLKTEYWQILEEKDAEIEALTAKLKKLEEVSEEISPEKIEKAPLENVFAPNNFEEEVLENTNLNEEISQNLAVEEQPEKLSVKQQIHEIHRQQAAEIDEFQTKQNAEFDDFEPQKMTEKKMKLGRIKGLGLVKSLFDSDVFEEEADEPLPKQNIVPNKIEVSLMEAERKRQDFKIDLNDKVAFTKLLFGGNESVLKSTINQLNTFDNLEDAKVYLSELYYEHNWKNVDDYAQRLWSLVENKFL